MNDMTCNQCQNLLIDLQDGRLDDSTRQTVDRHLGDCPACATRLAELWALEAAATRWSDQPVPAWNRRARFFEPRPWPALFQWAGTAASFVLLIALATQVNIDTSDGIRFSLGPDYITEAQVEAQLAQVRLDYEARIDRLRQQQAAGDQLVLTSLLQTSRRERRDDMRDLVSVLNDAESRRDARTRDALDYLISTQQEDRKDIQQLNQAIQRVGYSGDTL